MARLMLFDLENFCNENKIKSFIFKSSEQLGDRYSMMHIKLENLNLFANDSAGYLLLKNDCSCIKFHDVKYIRISGFDDTSIELDVVCGGEDNNIHRIVGKYNCKGDN